MKKDHSFNGTIVGGICWDELTKSRMGEPLALENFGYRVYSQNDEDGIIHEILKRIGNETKEFIELGVGNGLECNTHLLLHRGWHGSWIEADAGACREIGSRFRPVIENGRLKVKNAFITRENIEELIRQNRNCEDTDSAPDLLSIDIDGNDWHVWKAVRSIRPRLVCIEYNGKFPPDLSWKQAYDKKHVWDRSDWQGASLKALEELGTEKGYILAGTNLTGVNAFFVREDLYDKDAFLDLRSAEKLYIPYRRDLKIEAAGFSSRYCLADQQENKGFMNYYTGRTQYQKARNKERITKALKRLRGVLFG